MKNIFSRYKCEIILAIILFIVIIPAIINWLFKLHPSCDFFVAEWDAGDVLTFYGAMLASIATIVGVYLSIEYAQRNYRKDEANRVKPYFALTHYSSRSKTTELLGSPSDTEVQDVAKQPGSFYEEFKLHNVYIIINQEEIEFKDKLTDKQLQRLKSGGFEWINHGSGCQALHSHPFVSMPFDVENVGSGAATNTLIAFYKKGDKCRGVHLYTIKPSDSFYIHVFCDDADSVVDKDYIIEFRYGDILGNYYSQKYPVSFGRNVETNNFCTTVNLTGKQETVEVDLEETNNEPHET